MTDTVPKYDYLFKYQILGADCTGKTKFLTRYADDTYTDQFLSLIPLDFKICTIESPETSKIIKLQIWDNIRLKFKSMSIYRGKQGFIVMFDCTNRESFKRVPALFDEIDKYASEDNQKILVATVIDLAHKRQVSYDEAKQLADQFGVPYIETSAKNNINIKETIQILTRNVEQMIEKQPPKSSDPPPIEQTEQPASSLWSRCLIL